MKYMIWALFCAAAGAACLMLLPVAGSLIVTGFIMIMVVTMIGIDAVESECGIYEAAVSLVRENMLFQFSLMLTAATSAAAITGMFL